MVTQLGLARVDLGFVYLPALFCFYTQRGGYLTTPTAIGYDLTAYRCSSSVKRGGFLCSASDHLHPPRLYPQAVRGVDISPPDAV